MRLTDNVIQLVSGFSAGASVSVTLHPIDTLKTRLQQGLHSRVSKNLYGGLFKGAGLSVCAYSVGTGIFFFVYERAKAISPFESGFLVDFPSAVVGTSVALLWETPFEVAKQRVQRSLRPGETLWKNLSYVGARPFLMREIFYKVIQYPLYERLKRSILKKNVDPSKQVGLSTICGSIAACTSGFLTTPLDVTKTQMMVNSEKFHQVSTTQAMKQIVKDEGVLGLWRGVVPRMVWFSFAGVIFFGTYESTHSLLLTQM